MFVIRCFQPVLGGSFELPDGQVETKVIDPLGLWKSAERAEWETLKRFGWFNKCRQLQPIGNIPPAEVAEQSRQKQNEFDNVECKWVASLRDNLGGSVVNVPENNLALKTSMEAGLQYSRCL